eukprot:CCRYP_012287-RA/>CCRYP_012287-RA protein AED:0.10 eAED:0.10 QI:809/1/1/1/0.75/0.6/5/79/232
MTICLFPLGLIFISLGLVTGTKKGFAAPLKGAWEDCSRSSECKNKCCSKEFSTTHKCTPGGTICVQNLRNVAGKAEDWLDAINGVRETYQVDSLEWSNALKSEAQVWANEIAKKCVNGLPGAGQNPNDYGVATIVNMRNPQMAVDRWMANGVNALKIPSKASNSFTQMIWAGSQYVGCADATSSQSGKTCTASVCYYAYAGNCGWGKFATWEDAVYSGAVCSTVCPSDSSCT